MRWALYARDALVASGDDASGPDEPGSPVWLLTGCIAWGSPLPPDDFDGALELGEATGLPVRIDYNSARVTMSSQGADGRPRAIEIRGAADGLGDVVFDVR